jgi:hypothetical protein
LRPRSGQRRLVLTAIAGVCAATLGWAAFWRAWAADDIARVIENLRGGRTIKVRIQAATVLARLRDRRVVAELGRAAVGDRNPAVRVYVLRLLGGAPGGEPGDAGARTAIKRALADRRPEVRLQAQRSLADLDRLRPPATPAVPAKPPGGPQEVVVAVGGMGDRTGRAGPAVKTALRAAILRNLARTRGVRIADRSDPAVAYAIDGSIAKLSLVTAGGDVESTCAVELVVSRPPRGIVLIASGEATVIEPRASFRPDRRSSMEADALEHAVTSAHENLARFFATAQR